MKVKTRSQTKISPKLKEKQNNSYAIEHKDYLSLLSKSKNKNRRNKLLDVASSGELQAISECIMNIIEGNVAVSKTQLSQLKRHKEILRSLSQKCYPVKKKRTILKQKGGFLSIVLPLALTAIDLITSLIRRK